MAPAHGICYGLTMAEPAPTSPCLESVQGERTVLSGNCSIGRLSENTIRIASERASRRHATIHLQDAGEYWLIDLGSVNGTILNGRRLSLPTRLTDADRISVAGEEFIFHAGSAVAEGGETRCGETLVMAPEISNEPCWLMLADVEGFTPLSQRLDPAVLAVIMGRWVRSGKKIVEEHGGVVNKYLGDGYLSFWRGGPHLAREIASVARSFLELQADSDPPFRVVFHFGLVTIVGSATLGEESLIGPDVNFVFRMEKAVGSAGAHFCVSEKARVHLEPLLPVVPVRGEFEFKGFAGKHRLFEVRSPSDERSHEIRAGGAGDSA